MSPDFALVMRQAFDAAYGYMSLTREVIEERLAEDLDVPTNTVHGWRLGRIPRSAAAIEEVASWFVEKAALDERWVEALIRAARKHADIGSEVRRVMDRATPIVIAALPQREHQVLLGRERELERLMSELAPTHGAHVIQLTGQGGMGKTALALEAAVRCHEAARRRSATAPIFGAILFVSAKQRLLLPEGIRSRHRSWASLADLFAVVAETFDRPDVARANPSEQGKLVRAILGGQRTLLIVDNIEGLPAEDLEPLIAYLRELPISTKVILTGRDREIGEPLMLEPLSAEFTLDLIDQLVHRVRDRGDEIELTPLDTEELVQATRGVPLAVVWAIGRLVGGESVRATARSLASPSGDFARFAFESAVAALTAQDRDVLLAMSLFAGSASSAALVVVSDLSIDELDPCLANLRRHNLISSRRDRHLMLPLTRQYARSLLHRDPMHEQRVLTKWLRWATEFARVNGGFDHGYWHDRYRRLETDWENLRTAFQYCIDVGDLETATSLWRAVERFTFVNDKWLFRFEFLEWLANRALEAGDVDLAVGALVETAWTLNQEADPNSLELSTERLDLVDRLHADSATLRGRAAVVRAQLVLRRMQTGNASGTGAGARKATLAEVERCLDRAEDEATQAELDHAARRLTLFEHIEHDELELERERLNVEIASFRGELALRRGERSRNRQMLDRAGKLFEVARERAHSLAWQRAELNGENWIAEVEVAKGEFIAAERRIERATEIARQTGDERRLAWLGLTRARLLMARGSHGAARTAAEMARAGFERFGMAAGAAQAIRLGDLLPQRVGSLERSSTHPGVDERYRR